MLWLKEIWEVFWIFERGIEVRLTVWPRFVLAMQTVWRFFKKWLPYWPTLFSKKNCNCQKKSVTAGITEQDIKIQAWQELLVCLKSGMSIHSCIIAIFGDTVIEGHCFYKEVNGKSEVVLHPFLWEWQQRGVSSGEAWFKAAGFFFPLTGSKHGGNLREAKDQQS